jgi:aminoglycoside phosphotransferase (APT) family kinase protein
MADMITERRDGSPGVSPRDDAERIITYLQSRLTRLWRVPVTVREPRRLSGGASRDTWSLIADPAGGVPAPLILRCDPPDRPRPELMAREAATLTAAASAGVPVPRVVDQADGREEASLGRAYLLMEQVEGQTIPRRLLRDEQFASVRPALARQLGNTLARIHSIPADAVPGLPAEDPLRQLTTMYLAFDEPRPAIELGLRWLAENEVPARPASLVHGDFRNGNLMIAPDGLRAVLDWELAHLGNPVEDLGWLCVKAWRFGSSEPAGGFGPRQELLQGYAEIAGFAPSDDEQHWWEVYGTVRWAVYCRAQAQRYLSGADRSVELAVLGRRVCEQEHDILLALEPAEPRILPDVLAMADRDRPAPPHDRPDADALLEAVQCFLAAESSEGGSRLRFLGRVAANAIAIARREALLAPAQAEAHRARLAALGCSDDRELAQAIRDGALDERRGEVIRALRRDVADKLAVANPGYLAQPTG